MAACQVSRLPMMYEVNIFLTNRYVPIPEVLPRERLLVEQAGASGFYYVIARSALKRPNGSNIRPPCLSPLAIIKFLTFK